MNRVLKALLIGMLMMAILASLVLAKTKRSNDDAWLGVYTRTMNEDLADEFSIGVEHGALIDIIVDDSPADDAGLREGDVIIEINGDKVRDNDDLLDIVEDMEPGDKVIIKLIRNDRKKEISATLGTADDNKKVRRAYRIRGGVKEEIDWADIPELPELPDLLELSELAELGELGQLSELSELAELTELAELAELGKAPHGYRFYSSGDDDLTEFNNGKYNFVFNDNSSYIGVHMDELNEQLGDYFGVKDGEGVLITEVVEDSPAEEAGLEAGDVIVKIDNDDIEDSGDVVEAIGDTDPGDMVEVVVLRDKREKSFNIEVGERDEKTFGNYHFQAPDIDINIPNIRWFQHADDDEGDDEDLNYFFNSKNNKYSLKEYKKEMKQFNKELKNLEYEKDHNMKKELEQLKKELKELRKLIED